MYLETSHKEGVCQSVVLPHPGPLPKERAFDLALSQQFGNRTTSPAVGIMESTETSSPSPRGRGPG